MASYPNMTTDSNSQLLHEVFEPVIQTELNEKADPFLAEIEKNAKDIVGSYIEMAIRHGRTPSVGVRLTSEDTPDPGTRQTAKARYTTKDIYAAIQIHDKVVKLSKTNKGAYANELTIQMEDTTTDAKNEFARQLYGNGTGVLDTLTAAVTSSKEVPVANPYAYSEGQRIDIYSAGGTTPAFAAMTIGDIDYAGSKIILSTTATITTGSFTTIAGNYNREMTGLKAIFASSGTLYNIDRSTNKWIVPTMINCNGSINELNMQQCADGAEMRSGEQVTHLLSTYGVVQKYANLLQLSNRNTEVMELKGGYKAISFNGLPLIKSRYAEKGTISFLNKKHFTLHRVDDWAFFKDDKGAIMTKTPYRAAWDILLVFYGDLGCRCLTAQSRLYNITE